MIVNQNKQPHLKIKTNTENNNPNTNQPNYKANILLFVAELVESGLFSLAIKAILDENLNICNEIPNILITLIKLELFNNISKSSEEEDILSSFDFLKEVYFQFNIDFTDSSKRIIVIIENPLFLQSNFYVNVKESSFQKELLNDITNYMLSNKDSDGGMVDSMEKEILFYQAYYSKALESIPINSNVLNLISNSISNYEVNVNYYEKEKENEKNSSFFLDERRKSTGFDSKLSKLSTNSQIFRPEPMNLPSISIIKSNLTPKTRNIKDNILTNHETEFESQKKQELSSLKIFKIDKVKDRDMNIIINTTLSKLKHQMRFERNLKNLKITKSKKGTKVSIMNELNFKRIKREKIDKIVMRRFFNYVQLNKKNSVFSLFFKNMNSISNQFANGMFRPPFTYCNIAFFSINTSYLIWLFSHEEICCLYSSYMELSLESILSFIKTNSKFEWSVFEEEQMTFYLKNYHIIYSGNSFNN